MNFGKKLMCIGFKALRKKNGKIVSQVSGLTVHYT